MLENEDELKNISDNAMRTAHKKYSHITECEKLEKIIDNLLQNELDG